MTPGVQQSSGVTSSAPRETMHRLIRADLFRYLGREGSLSALLDGLAIPGFRYTYALRQASLRGRYSPVGIFFRRLVQSYYVKYGFQIPIRTQIGEGLYIGHIGTIVVNPDCVIGKHCNLAPGVVIGAANRGSRKGCPVIGERVWIGSNAVIVGKVTIGNDVLIAPGAYVNVDVPDHSIVVGNPAQITPVKAGESATAAYVENMLP